MVKEWRLIKSGIQNGAMNMAIDEAILIAHSEGKVPPTLRFYGWNPPTLSIGYFQQVDREVNLDRVKKRGFDFVRRPTGGRAVLHDQELTYSVIVSENYPDMPRTVIDSYLLISQGLLEGFRQLELKAEIVSLEDEMSKQKYLSLGTSACFDAPSWYELVVEGRKVVGSAQTRQRGVILQHGSILLDLDADALFDVLHIPSERIKERLQESFSNRAVAINQLTPRPIGFEEAMQAFINGFIKGMGINLISGELTPYEQQLAMELVGSRYGSDAWNFNK